MEGMDTENSAATQPPDEPLGSDWALDADPATRVWADRTGVRSYLGHSARGGSVAIGDKSYPGTFTPGELLRLALASCAAFSSDAALVRRLGPDAQARVEVVGDYDPVADTYTAFTERLVANLADLNGADRERLAAVLERAIDKSCTVKHTLEAPRPVDFALVDAHQEPTA